MGWRALLLRRVGIKGKSYQAWIIVFHRILDPAEMNEAWNSKLD